jgi:hypothetical protein
MTPEHNAVLSKRVASEVATMEYVERYTNIKVPHVLAHSADAEGDVRAPYILMSKVEGTPLSSLWDNLDDDKRRIILRQVIDILLELWSHRFDKNGALFKRADGEGKDAWYIESTSVLVNPSDKGSRYRLPTTSYAHAADYWLAYANANLRDICDEKFGSPGKEFDHMHAWFLRSIIPALFDPSIDTHGFPLLPGDFHSQNIMITDIDTSPRISAVIDWELSGPDFATTFAYYPLFIVDHPLWDDDHPLRQRNIRDQATFDELILEAESKRGPVCGPPLSHLISNGYPIYLFCQAIEGEFELYPHLFAYAFGDDSDETGFKNEYYRALMNQGMLKKDKQRFEMENSVWLEARRILGDDAVDRKLTMGEFKNLVLKHLDRFDEGTIVRKWLASLA